MTYEAVLRILDGGGTLALAILLMMEIRRVRDTLDAMVKGIHDLVTEIRVDAASREDNTPAYGVAARRRNTQGPK